MPGLDKLNPHFSKWSLCNCILPFNIADFDDMSCQMIFGEEPPELLNDPALKQPCFKLCNTSKHTSFYFVFYCPTVQYHINHVPMVRLKVDLT